MNNFSYNNLSDEEIRYVTILETLRKALDDRPESIGDIRIDLTAKEPDN